MMENERMTAICAGTGMVGGTVKGTMLTVSGDFSLTGILLVVFYAALSALVAYLTKRVVDWLLSRMGRSVKKVANEEGHDDWVEIERKGGVI